MRSDAQLANGEDHCSPDVRRLPYYVRSAKGEALVSWAWRLARKFEWNLATLAHVGWDLREPLRPDWWVRPDDALLLTLESRTGIDYKLLRSMTFLDWKSPMDRDGGDGSLGGWLPNRVTPRDRHDSLAVCPECLWEDKSPFLRQAWLIPWAAVCEKHRSALLTRCPTCGWPLRVPVSGSRMKFVANRCARCGFDLNGSESPSVPDAICEFHTALLRGTKTGLVQLPGAPTLKWSDFLVTAGYIRTAIWAEKKASSDRLTLLRAMSQNERFYINAGVSSLRDRLGGFMLLAWLLDDWPNNLASIEIAEAVPGGMVPRGTNLRKFISAASKKLSKSDSPRDRGTIADKPSDYNDSMQRRSKP